MPDAARPDSRTPRQNDRADLADVPAVNAVYAVLFPEGRRPARTIYQAAALPYEGRVKVQAVAVRD